MDNWVTIHVNKEDCHILIMMANSRQIRKVAKCNWRCLFENILQLRSQATTIVNHRKKNNKYCVIFCVIRRFETFVYL